jgi:hypothetical protein
MSLLEEMEVKQTGGSSLAEMLASQAQMVV